MQHNLKIDADISEYCAHERLGFSKSEFIYCFDDSKITYNRKIQAVHKKHEGCCDDEYDRILEKVRVIIQEREPYFSFVSDSRFSSGSELNKILDASFVDRSLPKSGFVNFLKELEMTPSILLLIAIRGIISSCFFISRIQK